MASGGGSSGGGSSSSGSGGGGRSDKKSGSVQFPNAEVLANVLTFSGGAAVGAIALFGLKKLYDYLAYTSPEASAADGTSGTPIPSPSKSPFMPDVIPSEKSPGDDVISSKSNKSVQAISPPNTAKTDTGEGDTDEASSPSILSETALASGSRRSSFTVLDENSVSSSNSLVNLEPEVQEIRSHRDETLHKMLSNFLTQYTQISDEDMRPALQVVHEIKLLFFEYFQELMKNHPISDLYISGDAAQQLLVVCPDHFEVRIPLKIHEDYWELVDAGESVLSADGFCFVKRRNLQFFSHGASPYDKYLVGDYFSPINLRSAIQDMTNRVAKWNPYEAVKAAVFGNEIQLTVVYDGDKQLIIDFIPEVVVGGVSVTASLHPRYINDKSYENLWQRSFEREEVEKLVLSHPNGCQLACLRILRAIQIFRPMPLALLSTTTCTSIVLHLLDIEDDWNVEAMSERFLDVLIYLQSACVEKSLAHYFCPRWNLLGELSNANMNDLENFISSLISQKRYQYLLCSPTC